MVLCLMVGRDSLNSVPAQLPEVPFMLSRSSRLSLGLALLALLAPRGLGQDGEIRELETELEKKLKATNALRSQLFKGDVAADPNNKDHQVAIDVAAKEVTYPLFWQWRSIRPTK